MFVLARVLFQTEWLLMWCKSL